MFVSNSSMINDVHYFDSVTERSKGRITKGITSSETMKKALNRDSFFIKGCVDGFSQSMYLSLLNELCVYKTGFFIQFA